MLREPESNKNWGKIVDYCSRGGCDRGGGGGGSGGRGGVRRCDVNWGKAEQKCDAN